MSAYLRSTSSALEVPRPMQGHSALSATSMTHQLVAQPRKVRLSFRKRSTDVEKAAQHGWRFATTADDLGLSAKRKHDYCMVPWLFHCFKSWNLRNLLRRIFLVGLYVPRSQWTVVDSEDEEDSEDPMIISLFLKLESSESSRRILRLKPCISHCSGWCNNIFRLWKTSAQEEAVSHIGGGDKPDGFDPSACQTDRDVDHFLAEPDEEKFFDAIKAYVATCVVSCRVAKEGSYGLHGLHGAPLLCAMVCHSAPWCAMIMLHADHGASWCFMMLHGGP